MAEYLAELPGILSVLSSLIRGFGIFG